MTRSKLNALVATLLVAASGCARETSDARAAAPPTLYSSALVVCSLLTPAELRANLGYRYEAGDGGFYPDFLVLAGVTTCVYPPEKGEAIERQNIYTGVVYAYARQIFDERRHARTQYYQGERQASQNAEAPLPVKSIKGLGDAAFWDGGTSQLLVLHERKIFAIHVTPGRAEPRTDTELRARRLASIAISRFKPSA